MRAALVTLAQTLLLPRNPDNLELLSSASKPLHSKSKL